MKVEQFILPLTVDGKKVNASGSKFKPMNDTLYRVSVPMAKWEKVFMFTLKNAESRTFQYYKMHDAAMDALSEKIMKKLENSTV